MSEKTKEKTIFFIISERAHGQLNDAAKEKDHGTAYDGASLSVISQSTS